MTTEALEPVELPAVAAAEARLEGLGRSFRAAIGCEGQFETDRAGIVVWTAGETPAAIGDPIDRGGAVGAAMARCLPFRDLDDGAGWLLTAVPYFEAATGRFLGYRGHTRRAAADAAGSGLFASRRSADAFASMAHEARTPLSAILGFAQMIEAETVGEAPAPIRERAGAIIRSATRLLDAVDDLAAAAQLDHGRYPVGDGAVALDAFLAQLAERFAPFAARRAVVLTVVGASGVAAAVEERLLARACDRLATALISVAEEETLVLAAAADPGRAEILLSRPVALAGRSVDDLIDPAVRVAVAGGSILGFGFALRLAKGLVEAAGGTLAIEPELLRLSIPAVAKAVAVA